MIFIHSLVFTQDTEGDYDFGIGVGLIVYGERPQDFSSGSIEANVLSMLNGTTTERRNFIENDLLKNAGFRRTGNIRFRRTDASEKVLSVLHGIIHPLSFGIVPTKQFSEIEYERLPDGVFYSFQTIIDSSELNDISSEVLLVMEIEYMLQIEFSNGILHRSNVNYYSEVNINKFEALILELPEFPESIMRLRERYLNIELPKIKNALERHHNPSENHLRALENLGDILNR